MNKYLVGGMIAVFATAAYAVAGLNFNNSQGIISVDNTAGTACVVGTTSTCMVPIVPWGVLSASTTRSSGNIAASNVFQSVLTASTTRLGCMVSNTSTAAMTIDVGTSPASATAVALPAGAKFNCATQAGLVINDQINLTSATVGATYSVWSQ